MYQTAAPLSAAVCKEGLVLPLYIAILSYASFLSADFISVLFYCFASAVIDLFRNSKKNSYIIFLYYDAHFISSPSAFIVLVITPKVKGFAPNVAYFAPMLP